MNTNQRIKQEEVNASSPSLEELAEWISEGVADATDGCRVELDGICEHGKPSRVLEMGMI